MKTRMQKARVDARWDTEWKMLKDKGQVGTVESMLQILPKVLRENQVEHGWHWCILLEAGRRGHVGQIESPQPQAEVDVDGKKFLRVNTALVVVHDKCFTLPIYEEK